MALFLLYLSLIVRAMAEVASMIITAAELYKLYKSWLERRQSTPQASNVIIPEAA